MAERSVNKVILLGRLTRDPELRSTASGTSVCTLRIATSESYKDDTGEWVERSEFHNVVLWARTAEVAEQYLRKGARVYIEGTLQTRSWNDRDGNKRWSTEIKGRQMIMLDGPGGGSSARADRDSSYRQQNRGGYSTADSSGQQGRTRPRRGSGYADAASPGTQGSGERDDAGQASWSNVPPKGPGDAQPAVQPPAAADDEDDLPF